MQALVIGPDFALGKGREGDPAVLRGLGDEMGFSVTVVPPLVIDGIVVSSTALRKSLAEGDMETVRKLSGRPFSLYGEVVHGAGRGEGLGFPTANIDVSPGQALPPDGVYAGWAHINGGLYQSMTNIGRCPTFNGCDHTVESFVIDYDGDLYGTDLKVDIMARLRDEKKFDSVEDLKIQMSEDIRQGRLILKSTGDN
jgi:riboflavin kinase/FMN adenylyltransferase